MRRGKMKSETLLYKLSFHIIEWMEPLIINNIEGKENEIKPYIIPLIRTKHNKYYLAVKFPKKGFELIFIIRDQTKKVLIEKKVDLWNSFIQKFTKIPQMQIDPTKPQFYKLIINNSASVEITEIFVSYLKGIVKVLMDAITDDIVGRKLEDKTNEFINNKVKEILVKAWNEK
jgi:hypothetical protein